MLRRFALYGFLKNQQYFEPFLLLVLIDKGMSFFLIGLLVAFRELAVNFLEIPSGVMADLFGRRRVLVLSHTAYVASFFLLGMAEQVVFLFVAMFLFAVGESFRTGTHKAIIFDWLRRQDRIDEKTKVYGYTRSWSKIGSAVSVLVAAGIVLWTRRYEYTFYLCAIPYCLGVINLLGYPKYLEGKQSRKLSIRQLFLHLGATWRTVRDERSLRRLVLESMGFEGVFHSVKDYLQPILKAAVIPLTAGFLITSELAEPQKVAIVAAPVYLLLHLFSAVASRQSHRVVRKFGGECSAIRVIWLAALIIFTLLTISGFFEIFSLLVFGFILLYGLHNIWRPVQVGRYTRFGDSSLGATILSVESQSRRLATMIAAPLIGLAVDVVAGLQIGGRFWPVGLSGVLVFLLFFPRRYRDGVVGSQFQGGSRGLGDLDRWSGCNTGRGR